jgi:HEAT repeat protein
MPASEQQVSVAAHRPPSSRSDHTRILPSVIVDVASEYVGLVERVIAGTTPGSADGHSADDAETELLRAGGYAMPAIMARFPGPVTIEPDRLADGPLPRVAECGPVLRLVASQRRTALPFVLSHVEDPDIEKRFWATYLLTELLYPDVLDPIVLRVFDPEPRVRRAARAAARAFAEGHPSSIVERLELVAMDGGETLERRVLAVEALGEMREALAIPALMPLLDDPSPEVVAAVRAALVVIARQDFGTSSQKWQAWWDGNKDRHRLEWLIDALMHEQAALRAAAGEELKTTTKEYFGYYDDLPKRERERAQSRYREWWNNVGRVRFTRSASPRG